MVIYRIVNTVNDRVYIGSTVCMINRKKMHIKGLIEKKHHNSRLQRDFNKYGIDCFVFEVLETGYKNKRDLLIREYELIARLKPTDYNIDRVLSLEQIDPNLKEERVKLGKTGTYIFLNKKSKPNYCKQKKHNKKKFKYKKQKPKIEEPKKEIKSGRLKDMSEAAKEYYKIKNPT